MYRQQKIEIGFYGEDGSFIQAIENINISAQEITEVPEIVGRNVPAAFLLNNNDWGFGYFALDEASIGVFETSLSKINNSLNRAVIIG